jgi:hypothetical protein
MRAFETFRGWIRTTAYPDFGAGVFPGIIRSLWALNPSRLTSTMNVDGGTDDGPNHWRIINHDISLRSQKHSIHYRCG